MSADHCEIYCFDEVKVTYIKNSLPTEVIQKTSQLFKHMGDETRLKVLYALYEDELCVCDVANIIDSTVATASHHLRLLNNAGLTKKRKQGKLMFYSLKDSVVKKLIQELLHSNKEMNVK
ncbi:ArsR/SmtB family transcription factor [Bacillus cereus]|uniref:ArsR/SmtB family transcription factor n=1 Tax=Bacillus cereus TaxID=1396 RepID=UPI0024811FAC|nr:metalloregulator ArsR/SmtB family transcription factor [Bacillus cereus]MDH8001286.1 metalloregulator ArsR/SmtB family transcription factor [Bacillus cereus]